MKKDDLKEKCRAMGLAVGGNNEALIARIRRRRARTCMS